MQNVVKSNLIVIDQAVPAEPVEHSEEFETAVKTAAVAVSFLTSNHAYSMIPVFQIISPDDIQIVDTGDTDRAAIPAVQDFLDKIVDEGFVDGNRLYVPAFAGSSDLRNGKGVFIVREKLWNTIDWCSCGAIQPHRMTPLTVGKIAKYLALMMSACRRWHDVFSDKPFMVYPEIENFGVFNDVEVPLIDLVDCVSPHSVERKLLLEHDGETMKITDGLMMYIIDDRGLNQRKKLSEQLEAFTVRLALHKGLMIPVLRSALEHFFEVHPELEDSFLKDAWGRKVDVLDCQVITFKSVFKGWKCFSSHAVFEKEFRARQHEIWVCVQAHGSKWAALPYQQLQTLDATGKEIAELAHKSADWLLEHAKPGMFGKIIGGNLGKLVDMYPPLINDPFVRESLQRAWLSKVKRALEGRVLHVAHNLFCAPDPVAVLEGMFGLSVKGVIAAHNVITSAYRPGRKLGCTRCPHLDHAWAIANNMAVPEEWPGFFGGTTIFYSCHDSTMVQHQMDYDGDHSCVTDNELLISIAERSQKKYGNVPLLYAAMDAGKKNECEDYETELKLLFRNLSKAPIGLYANALTKDWAIRQDIDWVAVDCLTRKANTCIDEAGGHGKDSSQGVAEDVVEKMKFVPKPSFLAVRNGHLSDDGMQIIEDEGNYRFYKQSVVDQYSAVCRLLLPQRISEIADLDHLGTFDPKVLMSDPNTDGLRKALAGLITDKGGLFNELCRSVVAEESMIDFSSSMKALPNFRMDRAQRIELAVAEFALDRDMTLDRAVDLIAIHLFGWMKRNDRFVTHLKRWFFLAFGDRILENVARNLNKASGTSDESESEEEDAEEIA